MLRRAFRIGRGFVAHSYYQILEGAVTAPLVGGLAAKAVRLRFRGVMERNPIFIHVPRAAGHSISKALYGKTVPHFTIRLVNAALGADRADRVTFGVLRDPLRRAISSYRYLRTGGTEEVPMNPYWRFRMRGIGSFSEYVAFLERNRLRLDQLDPIFRRQAFYLTAADGALAVDHVFLLVADDVQLSAFLDANGAAPLLKMNSSSGEPVEVDPASEAILRDLYRDDFRLIAIHRGETLAESVS